jgi:hypothetical protein
MTGGGLLMSSARQVTITVTDEFAPRLDALASSGHVWAVRNGRDGGGGTTDLGEASPTRDRSAHGGNDAVQRRRRP